MAQVNHRERLIAGAISCLQTKGFARTTARDITAASGANLASIGYHFGSTQALLNEALIRIFEQRDRHLGHIALRAESASPLERLITLFVAVRELFEAHRPLLVAFVEAMAEAEHSPELRKRMAAHYRGTRRSMASMLRASLAPASEHLRTDPDLMASFLMAAFDGLVLQWLLDSAAIPRGKALVSALVEWMALAAEQGTGRGGRRAIGKKARSRRLAQQTRVAGRPRSR